MNRIEVNLQTGEKTIIPLSDAEIAECQARAAAEMEARSATPTKSELMAQIQAIAEKVNALN